MPQSRFTALLSQHDLPSSFIYLAPVLPIVQVMWADGKNQIPERAKLHVIIENHCRALSELAGGMQVVPREDIELFDSLFIAQKPEPATLSPFFDVAAELVKEKASVRMAENDSLYLKDQLFQACLEIAAACPASVGDRVDDAFADRIVAAERRYIEQMFSLLASRDS
ncbi:hypothetical protein [Marinobacter sp. VGCF2001]|uniref:hypothetical protein n=1 Tax=Marinobacter sp. VGCF2001 TaxID=3417189 RepID=UPI003CF56225